MNINKIVDKAYEGKSLKELVDAPVAAISGISDNDAKLLGEAFNVKTIGDLAKNKYFLAALSIVNLSQHEA